MNVTELYHAKHYCKHTFWPELAYSEASFKNIQQENKAKCGQL